MIPTGLTSAQVKQLNATLMGSHSLKITTRITDLNGKVQSDVSDRFVDGEVNVDGEAAVSRNANLQFADPAGTMPIDATSPEDGALYMDRMFEVIYSVKGPYADDWIDIPVFVGPIVKVSRNNDTVLVECQGKELLAQGSLWASTVFKKGTPRTEVIKSVMKSQGETKLDVPNLPFRLPQDLNISRWSSAWTIARSIAKSLSRQVYYDAAGVCRLRSWPNSIAFRFKGGDNQAVLTKPSVSYSIDDVKNVVRVLGAKASNGQNITYTATAPAGHALHPKNIGKGNGRFLVESIESDEIRTYNEARELAITTLNERLLQAVEVSFDSLPVPYLEPYDKVAVETETATTYFRVVKFTIPLKADGAMTIGYNKKVKINNRRNRRK